MNQLLDDLIKVMTLERLEMNLFRGQSRDIGSPQVFGGQVLGQALVAATATAEDRVVHSLHAYFFLSAHEGTSIRPSCMRSTGHWTASISPRRRVVAISARAANLQHVRLIPIARKPVSIIRSRFRTCRLPSRCRIWKLTTRGMADKLPAAARRVLEQRRPFEFRPVHAPDFLRREKSPPHKYIWFSRRGQACRRRGPAPAACLPMCPISTCSTPLSSRTASPLISPKLVIASIDHAMWFNRSVPRR